MPKGLIILLILLLLGGIYYFWMGGGSPSTYEVPYLEVEPQLNEYTVGVKGTLHLPSGEFTVRGDVSIKEGGRIVASEEVNTALKGPTTYSINILPVKVKEDATLDVSIDAEEGGRVYKIKYSLPLPVPSPLYDIQPPLVVITPSRIDIAEEGYDITLKIDVKNPNERSLNVTKATLAVEGKDYPLSFGVIEKGEEKSYEVPLAVEGNKVEGRIELTYEVDGVSRTHEVDFSLEFPNFTPQKPHYILSYDITSVTNEGVNLSILLRVSNEGPTTYTIKNLKIKIVKGDVIQEKTLTEKTDVPPYTEKNFTLSFSAIPFVVDGKIVVEEDGNTVLSVPLELISPSLIKPPTVEINIEESNVDSVRLIIKNPNDFNIDIKDVDISVYYNTTDLTSNFSSSPIEIDDSHTFTATTTFVSGLLKIVIKYTYGIEALDMWFPMEITTYYRAS